MSEREQDTEHAKQEGAARERRGAGAQAGGRGELGLWDTKEHSDAPGPFGTGDQQTVEEAAGDPDSEDADSDD